MQALVTKLVPDDDKAVTCLKLSQWPRSRLFGPWDSQAAMWNECYEETAGKYVIICDQWARPNRQHLDELITLLEFGYGLVDLGNFNLFGFHKNLICRTGKFDERVIRFNDAAWDLILRMRERDVAVYRSNICPLDSHKHQYPWDTDDQYFSTKWEIENNKYVRRMPDLVEDCEDTSMFISWNKSVLSDSPLMHEAL